MLSDVAAERAVLAGLCKFGNETFLDVAGVVNPNTFTVQTNTYIYLCVKDIFDKDYQAIIDVPTLLGAAKALGFETIYTSQAEISHLKAILEFPVAKENVRKFAIQLRKLELTRLLKEKLKEAEDKLGKVNGTENLTEIISIAEDAIFNFNFLINDADTGPIHIGEDLDKYVEYLSENPVDQIGISTGLKRYDKAIGGGLRHGAVSLIVARTKTGKTTLAINIGMHVAINLNIPVLMLDSEMILQDIRHRSLARLSEIEIDDIETGKFSQSQFKQGKVNEAVKRLENSNFYHYPMGLIPIDEQLAIIRRWIAKEVGFNLDGKAKNCLVIYDYLKLNSLEDIQNNVQEHQLLGELITRLVDISRRYHIPILAFAQTNRSGISKEDLSIVSGSDRLSHLASNTTLFKHKSDEEIAEDGIDGGNRKLVPMNSRHGEDLGGGYINLKFQGALAKIEEVEPQVHNNDGFEIDDDDALPEI